MKKKSMFWVAAIVLFLLAVYGIWFYSPLRYLTRSGSRPDPTNSGTIKSIRQPVIVTKKILPDAAEKEQIGDIPRPLAVLKDAAPAKTPRLDQETEKRTAASASENKTPEPQPDGALNAQKSGPAEIEPNVAVKTQPGEVQVKSLKPEPHQPYSILLSSCRLPQSARKIVSDYKKVGLAPYVVKVRFDNGDEWLRVLSGHYQTRQEALEVKKEQRLSTAIVKKTPYTNLIGTYAAKEAMQADLGRLRKLGYSPYFLKTQNGQYKLLVGAFITREGAETHSRELRSKGIRNTVINR